jgi:very-short-patch-repair endonuclease
MQRHVIPKKLSVGEETLALHLRAHNIPFEREYIFHPVRRWRLDFCLVEHKIGIEVDGLTQAGGRHQRRAGIEGDCQKANAAVLMGYRLLRYTPAMVTAGTAIQDVLEILGK